MFQKLTHVAGRVVCRYFGLCSVFVPSLTILGLRGNSFFCYTFYSVLYYFSSGGIWSGPGVVFTLILLNAVFRSIINKYQINDIFNFQMIFLYSAILDILDLEKYYPKVFLISVTFMRVKKYHFFSTEF